MKDLKEILELKEENKLNKFMENLWDKNVQKYWKQYKSLLKERKTEEGARFLNSKNINPNFWELSDILNEWREIFIEKEFQRTGLRC